jgi:hypothetical protein
VAYHEKKHTLPYTIFFVFLFISLSCVFRSSVIVTSSVVVRACVAHETLDIAHEVGTVVKPTVTSAADAVFVLVMLLRTLLLSEFEAGSVLFEGHHGSRSGSSSPVVGSTSSRHCSFVLSLSQVATIWRNVEKVFQFFYK